MTPTDLVRADALRHYPELVASLGGDARALLRAVRIPPQALRNAEGFVSFRAMLELLELSAETLDCKDFGLRLAKQQGIDIFGPLSLAAQNCETVGDALECFQRFFHTHNPALEISLRPAPGGKSTLVGTRILLSRPSAHRQFDERNALIAHQSILLLSGNAYRPLRVLLPHSRLSPAATYRASFGCELRFDQGEAAIEVSAADLRRPVRGNNPQLRRIATAFLESQGSKAQATLGSRVRDAIKPLLPSGRCDQANVADALYLHPRTLQRRLADEGSSFEQIREEVRREVAEHYLRSSNLPLSQVTALLGYSEQSALTRSCRRWFKKAPLAMRRVAKR
ncbi:MAG TPA: AraC family transcriptional regulator ligand-binding domain-containing protein [Solimonas sp.]|nr:AraC family transcriptional regulator ligand-binding domain-containing protein [Solimonas sp.]